MDEMAVTQSVVDAVADRVPDGRVAVVHLEVGRLSGVLADAVAFCFDVLAQGTPAEGAALEISQPPGVYRCRACGTRLEGDDLLRLCARGSAEVEVVSGTELRVTSVEVREDA